jgi:hypothetical protein
MIIKGSGINIQNQENDIQNLKSLEHPFTHYLITNFF